MSNPLDDLARAMGQGPSDRPELQRIMRATQLAALPRHPTLTTKVVKDASS